MTGGEVVCDLRVVQHPLLRGEPSARFARELAAALERTRPELVSSYLLDPALPPPSAADQLVTTGKLYYRGDPAGRHLLDGARVLLSLTPPTGGTKLEALRPIEVDAGALAFVTVLHDAASLTPETASPLLAHRCAEVAREVVRSADAVLVSAPSLCDAIHTAVGPGAPRCQLVGIGLSPHFSPPYARSEALEELRRQEPMVRGPFVLCRGDAAPGELGDVLAAVAASAEDATEPLQLVVIGDVPALDRERLQASAGPGRLLLTGLVSEERLALLYQATDLFVALGGDAQAIDVVEALGSGAVVAAGDSSALRDVLPVEGGRFALGATDRLGEVVRRCLRDPQLREEVRSCRRDLPRWEEVAARSAEALSELVARPRRRSGRRRGARRVAVISPFPPMRSGVAGYSRRLVEALGEIVAEDDAGRIELDCFIDGRDRYPVAAEPVSGVRPLDARLFHLADGMIHYDTVLYVLGNSEYHSNALAALRRRPGVVYTHDVRLSGLFSFAAETRGALDGGLAATIARAYPDLPAGLGANGSVSPGEQDRYGLLLLREVAGPSKRLLVSSAAARRLAELDLGPELSERLEVLPFAVSCLAREELDTVSRSRRQRKESPPFRLASFGIVDPAKRPDVIVLALAELVSRGIDAELALVGLVSSELDAELRSLAADVGVEGRLEVTGPVEREEYLMQLGRAHLAVQLRSRFYGEASAAVSECLSAGLATVVPRLGWMEEIPDLAVAKVAPDCSPADLADAVAMLLGDEERRRSLAAAGAAWAAGKTYRAAAAALLEVLESALSAG